MHAIFGGTFNPAHTGHQHVTNVVLDHTPVTRITVIVAGHPYHKPHITPDPTNDANRWATTHLTFTTNPHIRVSHEELQREGPTYTWDTLKRHPRGTALIIGEDTARQLHTWHNTRAIKQHTPIIVIRRNTANIDPPLEQALDGWNHTIINTPHTTVSSTHIRHLISAKRPITHLVTPATAHHINTYHMYQTPNSHPIVTNPWPALLHKARNGTNINNELEALVHNAVQHTPTTP